MYTPPNHSPNRAQKPQALFKNLVRQLKKVLASPYGVAAIASLGVHGIVFAAIPQFTSASFAAFGEEGGTEEERTVPLVTLSPAEQGRLPNFNRPQLPSIPTITPGLSTPPRALPNATLFNPSGTRPLPSTRSPLSTRSTSRLSQNRPFSNPYISRPSVNPPLRSRFSSPSRTTIIPPPPTGQAESRLERLERELELERQAELEAKAAELAENTDSENTDSENIGPEAEPAPGLPELPPEGTETEGTETDSETSAEDGTELAANPETPRQPTQLERLQAKFRYDDVDTGDEQAVANYNDWIDATTGEEEESVATADPGELAIDANFALCPEVFPSNGQVGVLVAPDGTVSDVTILRSTGYEHLNQAAKDALAANAFPEADTSVRYPFDVIVGYDAESCGSADAILATDQNE